MIELIVIWRLASNIGLKATRKELKKFPYQIMMILLWICGEISGITVGDAFFGLSKSVCLVYLVALIGAVSGAGLAFLIIKLIPDRLAVSDSSEVVNHQDISVAQLFGRTKWIPVLVVLFAVSCTCITFFGGVYYQNITSVHASNPIIGIELNDDGTILQPVKEVSSKTKTIYLGFYFENKGNVNVPVSFEWYIDGHIAYKFYKIIGPGQVIVAFDRNELLELPEFLTGEYEVQAHYEDILLTKATFVVK